MDTNEENLKFSAKENLIKVLSDEKIGTVITSE